MKTTTTKQAMAKVERAARTANKELRAATAARLSELAAAAPAGADKDRWELEAACWAQLAK